MDQFASFVLRGGIALAEGLCDVRVLDEREWTRAEQEPMQSVSRCPVERIPVHWLMQAVGCVALRGRCNP